MAIQEQAPDVKDTEDTIQNPEGFMQTLRKLGKRSTKQAIEDPANYEFDGPCTD